MRAQDSAGRNYKPQHALRRAGGAWEAGLGGTSLVPLAQGVPRFAISASSFAFRAGSVIDNWKKGLDRERSTESL